MLWAFMHKDFLSAAPSGVQWPPLPISDNQALLNAVSPALCGPGWHLWKGVCLTVNITGSPVTYHEAVAHCRAQDGFVWDIRDTDEEAFVVNTLLPPVASVPSVWLGMDPASGLLDDGTRLDESLQ